MSEALLRVDDLHVYFNVKRGGLFSRENLLLKAVDGVSFEATEGKTFSIVGESGCGKTTTARAILNVETPASGRILWNGLDIAEIDEAETKRYRAAVQAVFQDPHSSMNPRMRIIDFVTEPLLLNTGISRAERRERAIEALAHVGLGANELNNFPHEFSGGQRQRVAIARALASSPRLIVLDEPVSSLDVSIRAQIMNLLKDLQQDLGLTLFLISHDLPGVRYLADIIAVMYLGELVEMGSADQVYNNPLHPYTKVLLSSIPMPFEEDRAKHERLKITGEVPNALNPPSGCRFHPRCPFAMPICSEVVPESKQMEEGQTVSCHLF